MKSICKKIVVKEPNKKVRTSFTHRELVYLCFAFSNYRDVILQLPVHYDLRSDICVLNKKLHDLKDKCESINELTDLPF